MKNLRFFVFTIFVSFILTLAAFSQNRHSEEVFNWLKMSALPLKSHTAGNGFDDLQPLKKTLREVRIVGLGEATHGTREHFQFKHRLIEFLVREMGFTLFAIETQYFRCLPINEYILNGNGSEDAEKLVKAHLSGIYQTEEVLALIKWMHEYNKTVPPEKKVRFYGFDVQTPHHAADFLRGFLKKYDAEYAIKKEKILAETAPQDYQKFWIAYSKRTAVQKLRLQNELMQMLGYLAANESKLTRVSSKAEFENALQAARVLVQSDQIRNVPDKKQGTDTNPRDRFMAETVEHILRREKSEAKVILWAHNFHLWKYEPNSNAATTDSLKKNGLNFKPMGSFLQDFFGKKYYSFGFVMDAGAFQAVDDEAGDEAIIPQEFTLKPSPEKSLGWYFSETKAGDFLIDLRTDADNTEVKKWLATPHRLRYAGASFSNNWSEEDFSVLIVLRKNFDGLIFIQDTTRARPLSLE